MSPTTRNLEWAAGFLEGEGYFGCDPRKSLLRVTANQKTREPLDRLSSYFGGYINLATRGYKGSPNDIFVWQVVGSRAAGLCMTMYALLSQRRRVQVKEALDRWRSHRHHNRHKTHCPAGHPYSMSNTYIREDGGRRCRICTLASNIASNVHAVNRVSDGANPSGSGVNPPVSLQGD